MTTISIDLSQDDYRSLESLAATRGMTVRDYLLEGKLKPVDDPSALGDLESLLEDRVTHHRESGLRGRSSAKAILADLA